MARLSMALAVPTSTSTSTTVTEAIASFVCGSELTSGPDELYQRATRAFIDTIGVAIAARQEPSFTILARTLGSTQQRTGEASVIPTKLRATATDAALLNATAGHALDFDDVADEISSHPSVVLVPALLALAEAHGSTGRALLEAYAVGFEVACAVALG